MSGAYTKEEVQKMFLDHVKHLVDYWAEIPKDTVKEQLSGLAFSMLVIFDGGTMQFPCMDIVLRPHEDDKEYCIDQGERYFEDGMAFNDEYHALHEFYCAEEKE